MKETPFDAKRPCKSKGRAPRKTTTTTTTTKTTVWRRRRPQCVTDWRLMPAFVNGRKTLVLYYCWRWCPTFHSRGRGSHRQSAGSSRRRRRSWWRGREAFILQVILVAKKRPEKKSLWRGGRVRRKNHSSSLFCGLHGKNYFSIASAYTYCFLERPGESLPGIHDDATQWIRKSYVIIIIKGLQEQLKTFWY